MTVTLVLITRYKGTDQYAVACIPVLPCRVKVVGFITTKMGPLQPIRLCNRQLSVVQTIRVATFRLPYWCSRHGKKRPMQHFI